MSRRKLPHQMKQEIPVNSHSAGSPFPQTEQFILALTLISLRCLALAVTGKAAPNGCYTVWTKSASAHFWYISQLAWLEIRYNDLILQKPKNHEWRFWMMIVMHAPATERKKILQCFAAGT